MSYIHTPEDVKPFAGFLHRPEKEGLSAIVAGPEEIYGQHRTGRDLNQFPSKRIQLSIHTWPPGKAHGMHNHKYWEQCYYVFAGEAEITVADETRIVGPGSSAFMPPEVDHDIVAVGDEILVAAVVTCLLDDEKISEPD